MMSTNSVPRPDGPPCTDTNDEQYGEPNGPGKVLWFELSPDHVDIGHVVLGGTIVILVAIMAFCACREKKPEKVTKSDAFSEQLIGSLKLGNVWVLLS